MQNVSSTEQTTIAMSNNSFTSSGGTDTFFHLMTVGPAQVNLANNSVVFNASSSTGFRMSLGEHQRRHHLPTASSTIPTAPPERF